MKKSLFYIISISLLVIVLTFMVLMNIVEFSSFQKILTAILIVGAVFVQFFVSKTYFEKAQERIISSEHIKKTKQTEEQEREEAEKQRINKEQLEKQINDSAERILNQIIKTDNSEKFSENLLHVLASEFFIVQGVVYLFNQETSKYKFSAGYALYTNEEMRDFAVGEGITGQVAKNMEMLYISNVPENYITVLSGLGSSSPRHMLVFPLIDEFDAVGIVEVATFTPLPEHIREIYKIISEPLGKIASQLAYSEITTEETF